MELEGPGWEMQEECERERWDELQILLAQDPAYVEWVEASYAIHTTEQGEIDDR